MAQFKQEYGKRIKIIEEQNTISRICYHINLFYQNREIFYDVWVDSNLIPFIFPNFRKMGLGSKLMYIYERHIASLGITTAYL